MKLLNVLAEEVDDFDQPEQSLADRTRYIQNKVKSLAHHRQIFYALDNKFRGLNKEGKLTPILRKQWGTVELKLKRIEDQLKQFSIKIGKYKVQNPLAVCDDALYTGPPEQYPDLTKTQVVMYNKLQEALAKVGMPPLVLLFGGRARGRINFVVVNANQTFAWRKHGSQYGGGNEIYFPGRGTGSLSTESFIRSAEKYVKLFNAETGAP